MEYNTQIVGMCKTCNEKESDLHYFINRYISVCDHLFILDDNSTNGTYEILLKMEEKFRNRFTVIQPDGVVNKKISIYTYACTHRPNLICDFHFGSGLPSNFTYDTLFYLYYFLLSSQYKAASLGNHTLWRHQEPYFDYDEFGNEIKIGDFIESKNCDNYNLLPLSVTFDSRIRLYIPE